MTLTVCWTAAIVALFLLAAASERGAIRRGIDGANGLIFLMAGLAALGSLALLFGCLWWMGDWRSAAVHTAGAALVGGVSWWALLQALDRAARARRP